MKTTEKAKLELQKLADMFAKGEAPQAIARVVLTCPSMPSSKWSLANRVMALCQTGEIDCRGFHQWKKANRLVKKGAHAAFILRPLTVKKVDEESKEERMILVGFGCVPVFPLTATEGDPLPELAPANPPALMDVAESFGVKVDYEAFGGDCYGFYRTGDNHIVLCTVDEQVFFHELAHAGHERVLGQKLQGGQDPKQEIVAELSACVLARMFGKKDANEGATFEYIKSYAEKMKKSVGDAIVSIIADVEKVLTLIIDTANQPKAIAA